MASIEAISAAVQAGGSVVAIGWAIWLWRRDRQLADKRRDAKAGVLAFRLMPILFDISMAADMAVTALGHIEPRVSSETLEDILMALETGVKLPPPPPENLFTDFDCLKPELARALAHLFYSTERFNRYTVDVLAVAAKQPGDVLPKMFPAYRERLSGIKGDFAICGKLYFEEFGETLETSRVKAPNS